MDLFKEMTKEGHEQVVVSTDPESGLKSIIAIHSTVLGPSLGGCRFMFYPTFEAAAADVLRLSKAMTYKAAISGLHLGGGKAVICGRPREKTPAVLRAFGRMVDSLTGLYFTAEDVGMTVSDLGVVREVTRYATGLPEEKGGGGDPSIMTARGVLQGMRRCLQEALETDSFNGKTVAVQGLGKVGMRLAEMLHGEGAVLIVSDIDPKRVRAAVSKYDAKAVSRRRIYGMECDIFSPCALGGSLNAAVIPKLRCRIVAGSANNQLAARSDAKRLQRRKILYAPDYVINAGGLINIACEMQGYDREKAENQVAGIGETLGRVFERARNERVTPLEAADRLVEERLSQARTGRLNG